MTHRWLSSALHGRWCANTEEALFDALRSGQAVLHPDGSDDVILKAFASIEVRELRA
jgi:hypothetical protein